jgi:hypothetical protein
MSLRKSRGVSFPEVVASDTDVKEVVRTMPRRKNDIPPFAQVVRTDMPFRDAVTFEIAVAGYVN